MEVSPSGSLTRRFPLAGGARHHEAVSRIIRPSIRTALTPRAVLRLVLRQTEGLIETEEPWSRSNGTGSLL